MIELSTQGCSWSDKYLNLQVRYIFHPYGHFEALVGTFKNILTEIKMRTSFLEKIIIIPLSSFVHQYNQERMEGTFILSWYNWKIKHQSKI